MIFLLGSRASGKSTVGRTLAEQYGYTFYDLDVYFREKFKREISSYVEENGWNAFRDREEEILQEVITRSQKRDDVVVATGGGIVERQDNCDLIRASGRAYFLHAAPEILASRLARDPNCAQRPSLTGKSLTDEVCEIVQRRLPLYRNCAHVEIDAGRAVEDIVRTIAEAEGLSEEGRIPV